jgi:hypothetical protein
MVQQAPVGQGFVISEASQPHSIGLLWTSDRPVAETSTWQHTTQQTDMLPAEFEPATPASEQPQTHALDRAATGIGNSVIPLWEPQMSLTQIAIPYSLLMHYITISYQPATNAQIVTRCIQHSTCMTATQVTFGLAMCLNSTQELDI